MRYSIFTLSVAALLTGCLKTRADLRGEGQDPTPQRTTVAQQQAHAQQQQAPARPAPPATPAARFEEYDEQMRHMNGRVDVIENTLAQYNAAVQGDRTAAQKEKQAQDQRLLAYEEAIRKLEGQVAALNEELTKLKTQPVAAAPAAEKAAGGKAKTPYDEGEELFGAKKWKEAIVAYQKYRDSYPKGKQYAESTYKIGVAFQELGMKDEAKAFYDEVTAKFPGSKEAKKAATRSKSIK